MSIDWVADQTEFMELGGQTVTGHDVQQMYRYMEHIVEEADEIRMADEDGDMVRVVDGLLDTIVVCLGALISSGINVHEAWDAVLKANLSKVDGSLGEINWRADRQIGKPAGFVGPEDALAQCLIQADWKID